MIPKEILQKVRQLEIYTNRLVNESLAGEYHSVFQGRGMEFLEVREYQQGRSLVWTSDMSAHWLPEEFAAWPGYRQLWVNCLDWLTGKA